MHIRHIAGGVAAAALIAVPGLASTAHAYETGTFRYHTAAGGQDKVDYPEPYMCYPIGDAEETVVGGYNATVFTARLYADGACAYELPRDIPPNSGFESQGAGSVKFFPAH
ncbi:hypothetical protein [Streptomyces litchfieldiae]|uniref:Secreted protein n=1 Tax=Streptomyces litchfieldiae TaxID=3075543 RepID=A0ABU2N1K3_9ACTN|nr:hypothetical protein [Streptomyces sp. DSM 44938]MDT0347760.1 hypothetical protein [Streptomyces sp. DSM 44938]